ncbi:MAG: diguanylate cyclase [Chloroflexi bacterium]|nr:diguanylate cyclase [Chloroflexota bacterium]
MKFSIFNRRIILYAVAGSGLGLTFALFTLLVEKITKDNGALLFVPLAPIVFGLGALILGVGESRVRRQAKMLDEAREKFSALTLEAVTNKKWEINFSDPSIPTCWETKQCGAEDCPSYGKEHVRCWLVAGTFCRGEVQGRFAQKFGTCTKCEIYQAAVRNDPINEINENFNNVMWVLREHEDMLAESNEKLTEQFEELEVLQRKTRELATSDMLTGLRNRGHFQKYLGEMIAAAEREQQPLSLIILDLDFFKSVNDDFGHQVGDKVLRQLGKLVREELGDYNYAARYGGEEFVIIMPDSAAAAGVSLAERLRNRVKRVADEIDIPDRYIGASFGVADFPSCATDTDSLISAADTALLFSKRKGRDRVSYFRDLTDTDLTEHDMDNLRGRLEGASLNTISALAEAVDASDDYSAPEAARLAAIAKSIAATLGLGAEQSETLVLAARMHDIGKIGVPEAILRKKDKLTDEEVSQVRMHPQIGQSLFSEAERLHDLISAILYHHERWDGNGYPEHLQGDAIPLMARIVGIIDAFRAMCSDRPYRKALSEAEAVAELQKGAGSQFDPKLVELFIDQLQGRNSSAAA